MSEAENQPPVPSVVWEEPDEPKPVAFVNQFLIQHQPDEFVLTLGQLLTPPLLGSEEERIEQLSRIPYVPIRIVGRYGFTRRRMEELIAVLQENLERHDQLMQRLREELGE